MPQTRYNVIEQNSTKDVITQCSDEYEAHITIQRLKDVNPHKDYEVEEVLVYNKEASRYGRDPELH